MYCLTPDGGIKVGYLTGNADAVNHLMLVMDEAMIDD
jgi:hypothetical protein